MFNNDIVTMKRLFAMLEKAGLESLFQNMKDKTALEVVEIFTKNRDVLRDIMILITGKEKQTILQMVKTMKDFITEHNKIYNEAMVISKNIPSGGKSESLPIVNSNYYLDIIYNLGKIGNFDCRNLNLSEAMYFMMRHNIENKKTD
jgi:DNA polymerase III delta prime subunit